MTKFIYRWPLKVNRQISEKWCIALSEQRKDITSNNCGYFKAFARIKHPAKASFKNAPEAKNATYVSTRVQNKLI